MSKPLKSQWQFGELFPTASGRKVFSVAELTGRVKKLIEGDLSRVWVTGEVTNFRLQPNGHAYFTVKDAFSQLSCVLFKTSARDFNRTLVKEGAKVILHGDISVYEPRGQYQMIVDQVELQGVGALQAEFENLKRRLQAEGLFDSVRKRPIPRFPSRIGIVTSLGTAALQDVLHVLERRAPSIQLVIASCRVQGVGAATEIARSISQLNEWSATQPIGRSLDVLLVTRGGGSLEDLWAFNEEAVARAIHASKLPVISAVGHEIDFTIADFTADLRAATPSAAAEIVSQGMVEATLVLAGGVQRMRQLARNQFETSFDEMESVRGRLFRQHPLRQLNERSQRLDDLSGRLGARLQAQMRVALTRFGTARAGLLRSRPARTVVDRRKGFQTSANGLALAARTALKDRRHRFASLQARLKLLSPQQTLERGYSITLDSATGRILRGATQVEAGVKITTRLAAGTLESRVEAAETR